MNRKSDKASRSDALKRAKRLLRQKVKTALSDLTPDDRKKRSTRVFKRLLKDPAFIQARSVLLFASFGGEVQTRPIIDWVLAHAKTAVLPRVSGRGNSLRLCRIRDRRLDLEKSFRGIDEPVRRCPIVRPGSIDCAVVPGLAFDGEGRRLGRGGGYYDRLLPKLRKAVKIGIGFSFQVVGRIPASGRDQKVDRVLTD
ncbi:MAG: 5-formyltetrahydrofolate cyclo-ligase [Candidatus Omnitrophota bacterium]